MFVRTYLNHTIEAMMPGVGYTGTGGDIMHLAWRGDLTKFPLGGFNYDLDDDVLKATWELHNQDDRPGRSVFRSLSMGDIIVIERRDYPLPRGSIARVTDKPFAITAMGFKPILDFELDLATEYEG